MGQRLTTFLGVLLVAGTANAGSAAQSRAAVLTTPRAVAGVAWHMQRFPGVAVFSDIACPAATLCYALAPTPGMAASSVAYRTADGGGRWTHATIGSPANHISCPGPSVCYAAGTRDSGRRRLDSFIAGTTDGGRTWTRLFHVRSRTDLSCHTSCFLRLDGIACPVPAMCYVVGSFVGKDGVKGLLLRTTNGGTTWTRATAGAGGAISCPSDDICYAVGNQGTATSTRDAGKTWTITRIGSRVPLTHIDCPSTTVCYAVGYLISDLRTMTTTEHQPQVGAVIAETIDAALSWRTRSSQGNFLDGVACPTIRDCYAVGYRGDANSHTVIVVTHDGGNHWAQERHPQTSTMYNFIGIACPTPTRCYAVGLNGYILTRR